MKKFIIIRHAVLEDHSRDLSKNASEQVLRLIHSISDFIGSDNPLILSANTRKAIATANLISNNLGTIVVKDSLFGNDDVNSIKISSAKKRILELHANEKIQAIILISHLECCNELFLSIPFAVLGKRLCQQTIRFKNSEMALIDLNEQTFKFIHT